jgi:hypothetical protein
MTANIPGQQSGYRRSTWAANCRFTSTGQQSSEVVVLFWVRHDGDPPISVPRRGEEMVWRAIFIDRRNHRKGLGTNHGQLAWNSVDRHLRQIAKYERHVGICVW